MHQASAKIKAFYHSNDVKAGEPVLQVAHTYRSQMQKVGCKPSILRLEESHNSFSLWVIVSIRERKGITASEIKDITNWIPPTFQAAAEKIAKDAVKRFLRKDLTIGLGSGPMAAAIIREMSRFEGKESLKCIPTSYQIKLEAECSGLEIFDESAIPSVDVVFDGADEVDEDFNMIKGGGGALLREKIIHSAAKKIVITAESNKFVPSFTWSIPVEVHPFAVHSVKKKLEELGRPKMRMLAEGYPYVTENGNFILDTALEISDAPSQEKDLKNIAGAIEVGLFTRKADVYYKANEDGSFETIELQH